MGSEVEFGVPHLIHNHGGGELKRTRREFVYRLGTSPTGENSFFPKAAGPTVVDAMAVPGGPKPPLGLGKGLGLPDLDAPRDGEGDGRGDGRSPSRRGSWWDRPLPSLVEVITGHTAKAYDADFRRW